MWVCEPSVTRPGRPPPSPPPTTAACPPPGNGRPRSTKSVATYHTAGTPWRTRIGSATSTRSAVPSSNVTTTGCRGGRSSPGLGRARPAPRRGPSPCRAPPATPSARRTARPAGRLRGPLRPPTRWYSSTTTPGRGGRTRSASAAASLTVLPATLLAPTRVTLGNWLPSPPVGATLVACVAENSDAGTGRSTTSCCRSAASAAAWPAPRSSPTSSTASSPASSPGWPRSAPRSGSSPGSTPRTPPSNKLRMLELAATHDFDMLLAIDTDTVVVGDVGLYAGGGRGGGQAREPRPLPGGDLARRVRRARHPRAGPLDGHHHDRPGHLPVLQQRRPVRAPRPVRRPAGELDQAGRRRPRPLRAAARHRARDPSGTGPTSSPSPWRSSATTCRSRRYRSPPTCRPRSPSTRCSPTR